MDNSPIVPEFNSWLEALVKGNGSDLHVKVGSPPMLRLPYGLDRLDRDPLSPLETQAIADGVIPEDRKAIFKERGEVDFAYSVANVGRFRANVFRQRGSISMVLRKLRFGGPSFEEIGLPDSIKALADEHARADPRDRPDRIGQDHDARRDDRLSERDEGRAHRHDRGPDRGAAQGRARVDQPARDRPGHHRLPVRAASRVATGPRCDPDRRDARHRDRPRRAAGRRNRSPRAVDAAYAGRHRDGQPRDRLLPAASAEAGAAHARRHVARDRLPAAGADGRRRPRAGARDPREHRPGRRAHHRRGEDLRDQGRRGRGRLLRHDHVRPVAAEADQGRESVRRGRDAGGVEQARLRARHAAGGDGGAPPPHSSRAAAPTRPCRRRPRPRPTPTPAHIRSLRRALSSPSSRRSWRPPPRSR